MQLELLPTENIEFKIKEIGFVFKPYSQRDLVYATAIIQQSDVTSGEIPRTDIHTLTEHVFNGLLEIKGDIKIKDEQVTPEKLKEVALAGKLQGVFLLVVLKNWASKILEAHGFFKKESDSEAV